MELSATKVHYAVCVNNEGYELDLEPLRVYPVLPGEAAETGLELVRVVDESGEDYLYPASYFVAVDIPPDSEEALLRLLKARAGSTS